MMNVTKEELLREQMRLLSLKLHFIPGKTTKARILTAEHMALEQYLNHDSLSSLKLNMETAASREHWNAAAGYQRAIKFIKQKEAESIPAVIMDEKDIEELEMSNRDGPVEENGILYVEDYEISVQREVSVWVWEVRIGDMYFRGTKKRAGQACSRALWIWKKYLKGEI